MEHTFIIIKPNAFNKRVVGKIYSMLEETGLDAVAMRMDRIDEKTAQKFYAEHSERPFFGELCEFLSSGHIVMSVWKGENAVSIMRNVIGATDPKNADEGTIRKLYGDDICMNSIHGSDSVKSAEREMAMFFPNHAELVKS